MHIDRNDTAVVFIDPQNEVLSKRGAAWTAVGDSVRENRTVDDIERLFQAAKQHGFEVLVARDATAGPRNPEWGDGYKAALINVSFLAHAVLPTDAVVEAMAETR